MERVAFRARLLPGAEAEYRRRHAAVWPDLLREMSEAGCRDYSIFLDGGDIIGVFEVDDFAAFVAAMDRSALGQAWEREMAELMDPCLDPATGFHHRLEEVFRLD